MKHKKFGFTLIEVSLFLAVSGLLFVAVMVGTQNSIWQQRYNDAVQSYTNFLRNIYAEVSNPQSLSGGRSEDWAIYGKLISFGQDVGLDGKELGGRQRIFVYDVVGRADVEKNCKVSITGPIIGALQCVEANIVIKPEVAAKKYVLAGITSGYSPLWGSVVEDTDKNEYTGSILVVRHPGSGTIMTLASSYVINVNESMGLSQDPDFGRLLEDQDLDMKEVNFCLNPYGEKESGPLNRNIRIVRNAHNASGVELVDLDSADNACSGE